VDLRENEQIKKAVHDTFKHFWTEVNLRGCLMFMMRHLLIFGTSHR